MLQKLKQSTSGAIVRMCAAALSCACLLVTFPSDRMMRQARADDKQYATVIVDNANIRNAPGTVNTMVIDVLRNGSRVIIGDVVTVTNDPSGCNVWCPVTYSHSDGSVFNGYIVDTFLAKDADVNADPDFETEIAAFPDSYKPYLRTLHKNHPNWHFTPKNVDRDFDEAVEKQSRLGVSLIENYMDDAWKSTEPGAYDWKTGTYTPYDGAYWVNASKAVVKYYLDPRNMIHEESVFQFMDLSYDPQHQAIETVQGILNGTFMESAWVHNIDKTKRLSYAEAFMMAADQSGANPIFLAAKVIQEVSPNGSNSISGNYYSTYYKKQYKDLFNYYNIGASSGVDPVAKGLAFARDGSSDPEINARLLIPWNTPYRSIVGGSVFIANAYINVGQSSIYLMKFNVAPKDATQFGNHQYMTNIRGADEEAKKMSKAYEKAGILDADISFIIPVYNNMPEKACLLPMQSGNPNNYLKELSVGGYTLTPQFDPMECLDYDLVVPSSCTTIHIDAIPASDKAKVTGAGDIALTGEITTAQIMVTAENGTSKIYTVNIARNTEVFNAYFTTGVPAFGNFFGGFALGTPVSNVKDAFKMVDGYTLNYLNMNGIAKTDTETICTGDLVQVLDAEGKSVYVAVVFTRGDANCDGKITSADLTLIARYILGNGTLTEAGIYGADANKDGKVSAADLTMISRYLLSLGNIVQ